MTILYWIQVGGLKLAITMPHFQLKALTEYEFPLPQDAPGDIMHILPQKKSKSAEFKGVHECFVTGIDIEHMPPCGLYPFDGN